MGHLSLDQLPHVGIVVNPGIPIVQTSEGLIVHDRDKQTWVLASGYNCVGNFSRDPNSGRLVSNYSWIEKTCDCMEFLLDFGFKPLFRDVLTRIKDYSS